MIERHATTIAMIHDDRTTSMLVRDYFDISRTASLRVALQLGDLGQADLVLCLLRLRDQATHPDRRRLLAFYIHRLVGRPILVGEPIRLSYYANGARPRAVHPRSPDDRKITWVLAINPRQPSTEAHDRWSIFRVGRTVAQLRARGVTRRDLRRAVRRNWIRMEAL